MFFVTNYKLISPNHFISHNKGFLLLWIKCEVIIFEIIILKGENMLNFFSFSYILVDTFLKSTFLVTQQNNFDFVTIFLYQHLYGTMMQMDFVFQEQK